jgi:hypothetical protein
MRLKKLQLSSQGLLAIPTTAATKEAVAPRQRILLPLRPSPQLAPTQQQQVEQ